MQPLIIRGGSIVSSAGVRQADILVKDHTISSTGTIPEIAHALEYRAEGKLLFPGLIDPHVHFRTPGDEHKEDWQSGSRAALSGGITTVLDMPNTNPPTIDRTSFNRKKALAARDSVVDFGLFVGATPTNQRAAFSLADEACGLKIYVGSSTGSLLVKDFGAIWEHFEKFPQTRVIAVHAEEEEIINYFSGQKGDHLTHRPPLAAAVAVAKVLEVARATGHRIHICHLSTARELDLVRQAKESGWPVTCEVCPHHLFLGEPDYRDQGPYAKMNPPLRPVDDQRILLEQLDHVDMVATDHAPHLPKEKEKKNPPSGVPGLETSLSLMLTLAAKRKLSYEAVARLMAEGPASLYGLEKKGRLAPGFEADITVVDPDLRWKVDPSIFHSKAGWSPFAGKELVGKAVTVFTKGRLAYQNGQVVASAGDGQPVRYARSKQ